MNKILKLKHIVTLLLVVSLSAFGQGKDEKHDQIKALKVSFLTTELKLTSDEAAKFWPVYNSFESRQFSIRHDKMRKLIKQLDQTGLDKLSEKEASGYLDKLESADLELLNLRKKLVDELKPIIGPVKILKLKKAEDEFNKKLLSKYKEKNKG
jgi:Spy/CpxP family protein refolding chaperone